MPEFSVEVVFDVYCSCGAALCNQSDTQDSDGYRHRSRSVTVEPCEKCKDAEYEKGYAQGEIDATPE